MGRKGEAYEAAYRAQVGGAPGSEFWVLPKADAQRLRERAKARDAAWQKAREKR